MADAGSTSGSSSSGPNGARSGGANRGGQARRRRRGRGGGRPQGSGQSSSSKSRSQGSGGGGRQGGQSRNRSGQGGRSRSSSGGANRGGSSRNSTRPGAAVVTPPVAVASVPAPTVDTSSDVQANRRRAVALCVAVAAVPAIVLGVIGAAVAGVLLGVIVLVVVAAALAAALWWGSTALALRRIDARNLRRSEEPRLLNMTQGLCATMGLAEPFVMTIDDDVPNACAIGRSASDAVVVVTTGLTRRFDLVELEGVIAHELAHVQRGDTAVAGVVLAIGGGWCRALRGGTWVHGVLGHGREYRADQIAVAAVRYPPGLRDALGRLRPAAVPARDSVFRGPRWEVVRWAWLDPSLGDAGPAPVGELDDTSVRVEALDQY